MRGAQEVSIENVETYQCMGNTTKLKIHTQFGTEVTYLNEEEAITVCTSILSKYGYKVVKEELGKRGQLEEDIRAMKRIRQQLLDNGIHSMADHLQTLIEIAEFNFR
jgi:hypothetical protein